MFLLIDKNGVFYMDYMENELSRQRAPADVMVKPAKERRCNCMLHAKPTFNQIILMNDFKSNQSNT